MKRNNIYIFIGIIAVIGVISWSFFGENLSKNSNEGTAIVTITVPSIPSNLQVGNNLFDSKCSRCHGANAVGTEGSGPPLVHKIYEPNHHADGSFALAAKNGVRSHHWPFGNMPAVEGITDAEIKEVIKYVRYLQRANGIGQSE